MKKGTSRKLTKTQKAELQALAALPEDQIDTRDIPEIRDWSGARRNLLYRPVKRLDERSVIRHFPAWSLTEKRTKNYTA